MRRWPDGKRRVVIGINTFGALEGPTELETPQHSNSFKQMLKLQMLMRQGGGAEALCRMLLEKRRQKLAARAQLAAQEAAQNEPGLDSRAESAHAAAQLQAR